MPVFLGTKDATDPDDQPWLTGFRKLPVQGPVEVTETGLAGDGHADLTNHGGRDKAILAYAGQHYQAWKAELERSDIAFGLFGENLTVSQGTEEDVCIGDVFSIGDVKVQVSQPRQPCWKLGRYAKHAELPKRVVETGFCGWYLRVLQPGFIEAGMNHELVERTQPEWTILRAHLTKYAKKGDERFADKVILAQLPEISELWKDEIA